MLKKVFVEAMDLMFVVGLIVFFILLLDPDTDIDVIIGTLWVVSIGGWWKVWKGFRRLRTDQPAPMTLWCLAHAFIAGSVSLFVTYFLVYWYTHIRIPLVDYACAILAMVAIVCVVRALILWFCLAVFRFWPKAG